MGFTFLRGSKKEKENVREEFFEGRSEEVPQLYSVLETHHIAAVAHKLFGCCPAKRKEKERKKRRRRIEESDPKG